MSCYLYAYFRAGLAKKMESQHVHFAISPDGLHFKALNRNLPILEATKGTKGVRDPHIFYNHFTGCYTVIGTDLDASGGNWGKYANDGSLNIAVWESKDLIHWSDEQLYPLAKQGTGCMWAPTVCFDREQDAFAVFFTANKPNTFDKCIWVAHTRDFKSYSEPFIFKEPEPNVKKIRNLNKFSHAPTLTYIDSTVFEYKGMFYHFVKREQDVTVTLEVSDSMFGEYHTVREILIGAYGVEGPAIYPIGDERWILMLDGYCGPNKNKYYFPSICNGLADLERGNFKRLQKRDFLMPPGGKHGSVIEISEDEYNDLKEYYGV